MVGKYLKYLLKYLYFYKFSVGPPISEGGNAEPQAQAQPVPEQRAETPLNSGKLRNTNRNLIFMIKHQF